MSEEPTLGELYTVHLVRDLAELRQQLQAAEARDNAHRAWRAWLAEQLDKAQEACRQQFFRNNQLQAEKDRLLNWHDSWKQEIALRQAAEARLQELEEERGQLNDRIESLAMLENAARSVHGLLKRWGIISRNSYQADSLHNAIWWIDERAKMARGRVLVEKEG